MGLLSSAVKSMLKKYGSSSAKKSVTKKPTAKAVRAEKRAIKERNKEIRGLNSRAFLSRLEHPFDGDPGMYDMSMREVRAMLRKDHRKNLDAIMDRYRYKTPSKLANKDYAKPITGKRKTRK